tara:strand:+ start:2576 stop:2941 length:366 start_codon:yes stop_codon:yes gene_type:complete
MNEQAQKLQISLAAADEIAFDGLPDDPDYDDVQAWGADFRRLVKQPIDDHAQIKFNGQEISLVDLRAALECAVLMLDKQALIIGSYGMTDEQMAQHLQIRRQALEKARQAFGLDDRLEPIE